MSTMESLLDKLDETRMTLLEAIELLPDEALMHTNAIGRYSVADVLVNLTVWEAELVTGMMRLDQGKKPGTLVAALSNRQEYNQKRFAENQGRDLDRIFDDLQKVRVELEGWLEVFSERDLIQPKRFPWFGGKTLAQIIAEVTFENEKRYLPLLNAFAQKWQDSRAGR
ncbi:MAG: ClbS/DfsB family four-helix bundle protein [Anaerolineales bacterium]|nr:ClbS/DfsB family four-helix bundle protein [Anaerolineales bacterium]